MDEQKRGFQGLANELKKKSFFTEDDDKNINIKSQIEKHYNIEKCIYFTLQINNSNNKYDYYLIK